MSGGRSGMGWTLGGAAVLGAVWAAGLAVTWIVEPPGPESTVTVLMVAGGCLAGALGGWLLARQGDRLAAAPSSGRHGLAVAAGLGAIAVRLAPPLTMLAWLSQGGVTGTQRLLLGLYLSLLATDIVLTIIGRSGPAEDRGKSGAN